MAELVDWPELERLDNPLDPEAAPIAPVQIRFQIRPKSGEDLAPDLAAECSVAGHVASTPGAVLSFGEWEKDKTPTFYCYALARELHEGDEVKLKVRPRPRKRWWRRDREQQGVVWEKDFHVRKEGDQLRLE